MLDLLEAFANMFIVPSFAFGLLIGALVGACISWFLFSGMEYKVIAISSVVGGFINYFIFWYIDRWENKK